MRLIELRLSLTSVSPAFHRQWPTLSQLPNAPVMRPQDGACIKSCSKLFEQTTALEL